MKIKHAITAAILLFVIGTQAAVITVPGSANPWLSGMPSGSTAVGPGNCIPDSAPAQSAVFAGIVSPGAHLTFTVTGATGIGGQNPLSGDPDGYTHPDYFAGHVAENGVAPASAMPQSSLVGVFLDNSQPNLSATPSAFPYLPSASIITPGLKQVFFIGDGLTGTGSGQAQEFLVPAGATRLFLGTYDNCQWSDNPGSLNVTWQGTSVDLVASSLIYDATLDAFLYEYQINGGDLTQPLTVRLLWATGPTLADALTTASEETITAPSDLTAGSHTSGVLLDDLILPPPDANYLLLVVDPDNDIAESDKNNNVFPLLLPTYDISATQLDSNSQIPGFNYGYRVTGNDLTQPLAISLFWAPDQSLNLNTMTLAYSDSLTDPADLVIGDHPKQVALADMAPMPAGTEYLILGVNSDFSIPELNYTDNWRPLLVKRRTPAELALLAADARVPYAPASAYDPVSGCWECKGWVNGKFAEPEDLVQLDCSGLTYWAYNKSVDAGTCQSLSNPVYWENANFQFLKNTTEIVESEKQPGDLIFFDYPKNGKLHGYASHVAMFVGSGVVSAQSTEGFVRFFTFDEFMLTRRQYLWHGQSGLSSGFRRVSQPIVGMPIGVHSPVDLEVTDPLGNTINKNTTIITDEEVLHEVIGVMCYSTPTFDADSNPDARVTVPSPVAGIYTIRVFPKAGVSPDATYSLDVTLHGITTDLARDARVSDIPPEGQVYYTSDPSIPDTVNPVVHDCPGDTTVANDPGLCGAQVTWTVPTATDNVGVATFTSNHNPGEQFPAGTTTVTYTATDAAGNQAICSFTVTVLDCEPPKISAAMATPSVLWPSNNKLVDVTINYDVTDGCDTASGITCTLSVTSNEHVKGCHRDRHGRRDPNYGDRERGRDAREFDWVVIDSHHVRLRAEKADRGKGRIYWIKVTCTDSSGNSTSKLVSVRVPKSQGKGR